MVDIDGKFLERCFPQPIVSILYSLLSEAIHVGSVPGTITFSYQFAISILDAILLSSAVFVELSAQHICELFIHLFIHDENLELNVKNYVHN